MDEIFADMQKENALAIKKQRSKYEATQSSLAAKNKKGASIEEMIKLAEAKQKKEKKKEKKERKDQSEKIKSAMAGLSLELDANKKTEIRVDDAVEGEASMASQTAKQEVVTTDGRNLGNLIARHISVLNTEADQSSRKRALQAIHDTLFIEYTTSDEDYCELFGDVCKTIFKRYNDKVEKCRDLAYRISTAFFSKCSDIIAVLGYFIPALMSRVPQGIAYDEEMKLFVFDLENHEAYRRGKAVTREDRTQVTSITVVEPSEEVRALAVRCLSTLLKRLYALGSVSLIHPYFHECILYLQAQLRDPFAEVKVEACEILTLLAQQDDFNSGMKYFATALCRSLLPLLRHRHSKVRMTATAALTYCMAVPDRAKLRGSGTEALVDLVGFKEENVLNVSAFYISTVSINYLAEIVQDQNTHVRMEVCNLLHVFLTEIGDRYDHQTRLLPYLLDLITDSTPEVAERALATLQQCGKMFEEEHQKDIIERRQYGVDGDRRINLSKPLPAPFTSRPRLGMRLYVRGNAKRFLTALVNELTNWIGPTRIKSANLLKVIIVCMEEHLTMEAHTLLPAFIKALGFAKDDNDKELYGILRECYELLGRYILPEVYIHFILPRLTGDPAVVQFGVDTATRETVLEFLDCLLQGSVAGEIALYFNDIVTALVNPFVISPDSARLQSAAITVFTTLLTCMVGKGQAAIAAMFMNTGRLASIQTSVTSSFTWLVGCLHTNTNHEDHLKSKATQCLSLLAQMGADYSDAKASGKVAPKKIEDEGSLPTVFTPQLLTATTGDDAKSSDGIIRVTSLFEAQLPLMVSTILAELESDPATWHETLSEQAYLKLAVACPWKALYGHTSTIMAIIDTALQSIRGERTAECMDALLGGPPGTAGGYGPSGGAAQTLEGVTVQIVQNRDILGFWSDLLYALLEPVVYASSHVESTEGGSGECYSEFANCRSLSLLSVIGGAALTELREAIYSKTVLVMRHFVLSPVWECHDKVRYKRMKLLYLLFALGSDERCHIKGAVGESALSLIDTDILTTLGHVYGDEDHDGSNSDWVRTGVYYRLLKMSISFTSSTPLVLRSLSVRVATRVLECAVALWYSGREGRQIRPISAYQGGGDAGDEKSLVVRTMVGRECCAGIVTLLSLVKDSNEGVRIGVVEALRAAAPLLNLASATNGASNSANDEEKVEDEKDQESQDCSYEVVVSSLATEALLNLAQGVPQQGSDDAFSILLDDTLRCLAVISPASFLGCLEAVEQGAGEGGYLPPLTEAQKGYKEELPAGWEALGEWRTHVSVLQSLP